MEACTLELKEIIKTKGDYQLGKSYDAKGRVFYTIKNIRGNEKHHAHLKKYSIACSVLSWVYNKKIPKNEYYIKSCLRLTIDKTYAERLLNHEKKEKYVNINKGVFR
ncbi:MAG: hypothetical protein GX985_04405 [Gallicola sp.]|nr:hypothetical protein [Gallicola sp.]